MRWCSGATPPHLSFVILAPSATLIDIRRCGRPERRVGLCPPPCSPPRAAGRPVALLKARRGGCRGCQAAGCCLPCLCRRHRAPRRQPSPLLLARSGHGLCWSHRGQELPGEWLRTSVICAGQLGTAATGACLCPGRSASCVANCESPLSTGHTFAAAGLRAEEVQGHGDLCSGARAGRVLLQH